jgi:sigma-70-like protein
MSAALVVLPMIWATVREQDMQPAAPPVTPSKPVAPSLAFYRKYTEALLRRYAHMAMETGRVPSLLGRELFRGRVTNYVVHGFDDVVIFVHDVERCLAALDSEEQQMIERIAVQEYTLEEAAGLMHLPLWTINRRYGDALDTLTRMFLDRKMLEPAICCQEPKTVEISPSH